MLKVETTDVLVEEYAKPRNVAIQIFTDMDGPYDKPTINPDVLLEKGEVALHPADYHKESIDFLVEQGYISAEAHRIVPAGNYDVEVRMLLKK